MAKRTSRKSAKVTFAKKAGARRVAAKAAKRPSPDKEKRAAKGGEAASKLIDGRIRELGDWRGKTLEKVRRLIKQADPEIVEEWKWMGTPVWSHNGNICTGETYKKVVKLTFAKGASLQDPSGLFNSSLEGNVRRAIDIHETDTIDKAALADLIRAAVALNLESRRPRQIGNRSA
jgi:hypothetical protein